MDESQDFCSLLQDWVIFPENRLAKTEVVIGKRKWLTLLKIETVFEPVLAYLISIGK
jgi:hypothetical protein